MTRASAGNALVLGFIMILAVGCASGQVTGRVAQQGAPDGPLSMTWTSGIWGESGKMAAVMPDGERFSGTYQVVKPGMSRSTLEASWVGEAPPETQGDIDGSLWGAARDPALHPAILNNAVATLRGDRGTTMLCRFKLDAGGAGMGGGGNGECQTSRGAKITAQF